MSSALVWLCPTPFATTTIMFFGVACENTLSVDASNKINTMCLIF